MEKRIGKIDYFYTYQKLVRDIQFLKYEFKEINSLEEGSIGKSILNHKIPYLKVGEGNKKILINAAHHANEWITSLVSINFFEKLLNHLKKDHLYKGYDVNSILSQTKLFLVPMVNPDGVDLVQKEKYIFEQKEFLELIFKNQKYLKNWKANIRGVDLNLNYPTGWEKAKVIKRKKGVVGPNYRDYVGPNPLSELESQSLANFTTLQKFNLTISLHSQGEEIYWDDRKWKN